MNDELLSAHLDGELSEAEARTVDDVLAADASIAARYRELAEVRALLRGEPVHMPAGAFERIVGIVEAADTGDPSRVDDHAAGAGAPVIALSRRRRVPGFAAVAAAIVIIVGVVGGVGDTSSVPAIGDLIAQHEAAAAVISGDPMPAEFAQMDDMPMDKATEIGPGLPANLAMQHAFVDGPTVHLVYVSDDGETISLFRNEGEPDAEDLEPRGLARDAGSHMWSGPTDDAYVAVIDGSGFVWVMVSTEPHDDMLGDMMDDLPSRSPSLGDRFRETADWVVDAFRLGD